MASFQASIKKTFDNPIESKRRDLKLYKERIKFNKEKESKNLIEIELKHEEAILGERTWITRWYGEMRINNLKFRINELNEMERMEDEIEKLEDQRNDNIPGRVWWGYPNCLDKTTANAYRNWFRTLPHPLTQNVPNINIIMIGETGAGKSSFLNTFVTALANSQERKKITRESPCQSGEESATKRMLSKPLYVDSHGPRVPCNFYDVPGLVEKETQMEKTFDRIIEGLLVVDEKMNVKPNTRNPTPADQVHCILYVIKANSNLLSERSDRIKNIIRRQNSDDGVRQFVIVTAADKIVLPGADMKDIYRFQCVLKFCEKVSQEFGIALGDVIPVSNYFGEGGKSEATNAMSLYCLWRVFASGIDYINQHWNPRKDF